MPVSSSFLRRMPVSWTRRSGFSWKPPGSAWKAPGRFAETGQREARNIGVFAGVTFNKLPVDHGRSCGGRRKAPILPIHRPSRSPTVSPISSTSPVRLYGRYGLLVSSLMAIHLACESLKRGECDAANAGVSISRYTPQYISRFARDWLCRQRLALPCLCSQLRRLCAERRGWGRAAQALFQGACRW